MRMFILCAVVCLFLYYVSDFVYQIKKTCIALTFPFLLHYQTLQVVLSVRQYLCSLFIRNKTKPLLNNRRNKQTCETKQTNCQWENTGCL